MAQAQDLLTLPLRLTAMQLPDCHPQPVDPLAFQNPQLIALGDLERACVVVVYPGEPTEILVEVENPSDRPLRFHLGLESTFPGHWCSLYQEGQILEAHSRTEAVIYCQVAPDFFEQELTNPSDRLILDYEGMATIQYGFAEEDHCGYGAKKPFLLHVRPRSLYRQFLPDRYGQVDFIGRFLKIFEESFEPAVEMLDNFWAYLDPLTAPEGMLPFLAHWVGWDISPSLGLAQQRFLIKQAMELYKWRGTKKGLRLYLHLYTQLPLDEELPEFQKHISIQEVFTGGLSVGTSAIGDNAFLGGGQPFHFVVTLRTETPETLDSELIRRIIEQQKPAFCSYDLHIRHL